MLYKQAMVFACVKDVSTKYTSKSVAKMYVHVKPKLSIIFPSQFSVLNVFHHLGYSAIISQFSLSLLVLSVLRSLKFWLCLFSVLSL